MCVCKCILEYTDAYIHVCNTLLQVNTKPFISEFEKQVCNQQPTCSGYAMILIITVLQQFQTINVKKVITELPRYI